MIYNGAITITSPKGGHRTFEIKTKKSNATFAAGKRILALLSGPDNTMDYQGFAFVDDAGVHVWRKKQSGDPKNPSAFEVYAKMVQSLSTEGEASRYYKMGYRVEHERTCRRCNRRLTNPESIQSGLGPECAGRA